jgi:hypothetical protein
MDTCQHFAKVVGRKLSFMPGSDIATTGERIEFPQPPTGVRARLLAVNPHNPVEQIWLLCVDKELHPDLSAFWQAEGVTQLTYQELVALGKQYDPNFVPPPIVL